MYMPFHMGSSKLLIYFHANAEDIVLSHDLLDYMRVLLRVNIVAVEYPGYGLYNENYQKRYTYPKPVNPNLRKDFNTLNNLKMRAKQQEQQQYKYNNEADKNYVKEARLRRDSAKEENQSFVPNGLSNDTDFKYDDESSMHYMNGFNCRPSFNT